MTADELAAHIRHTMYMTGRAYAIEDGTLWIDINLHTGVVTHSACIPIPQEVLRPVVLPIVQDIIGEMVQEPEGRQQIERLPRKVRLKKNT